MDQDLSGKMVGVWFPISMFIAIGFEHSVANMFILPAGLFSGPERVARYYDDYICNILQWSGNAPLTESLLTRNAKPALVWLSRPEIGVIAFNCEELLWPGLTSLWRTWFQWPSAMLSLVHLCFGER